MSEVRAGAPGDTSRGEQGVALILVLWILVLLTLLVMDFAFATRLETRVARNYLEEAQAYYLAQAAVQAALAEILEDYDYTYLEEGDQLVFAKRNPPEGKENEAPNRRDLTLGPGLYGYELADEESKININVITQPRLRALLEEAGLKDSSLRSIIADSILDWIDSDHLHKLNGAEDDYYESNGLPYEAKDRRIDTIEELLLVRGVTPAIFYGEASYEDGEPYAGLVHFLTTTGAGLNNNTASETVLRTLYTDQRAAQILARREANEGVYSKTQRSRNFTIVASGRIPGSPVRRRIKAIVSRNETPTGRTATITYWNDNYLGR
ncbi:general secretion pathway protein GspK [Nitrospinae bacterium AH_259_B05_G02_I21]|nr:general secretion pathway protein GspK [Nitrospinae bacterium AH_259_B05_G02_I21]